MTPAERRAELDDTIEALARLPSYQRHSREALEAVSDTLDYIRALTGTLPPQCKDSLDRAFTKALAGDSRSAINSLLQTLTIVDALTSNLGVNISPTDPLPPARDPTNPKPLRDVADALLTKLRKNNIPPQ